MSVAQMKIDRHRGLCATCGAENVCHTSIGVPYARHFRSPRHQAAEALAYVAEALYPKLGEGVRLGVCERVTRTTHLFARVGKVGYFAVVELPGLLGTLDRAAYRTIAAEAAAHGVERPFHVYAKNCIYSGPGLEVYQETAR